MLYSYALHISIGSCNFIASVPSLRFDVISFYLPHLLVLYTFKDESAQMRRCKKSRKRREVLIECDCPAAALNKIKSLQQG